MLQLNQLAGFGARRRGGPITVTDLGDQADTGTDNQSNFAFGSFGTEGADRRLVAIILGRDSASAYTCTGVTIGGVAATVHADCGGVSQQTSMVIASAIVPTGASGSVVVNWSEALASNQSCTLLELHGTDLGSAASDSDALTDSVSDSALAGAIDCPARGIVIGGACATGAGLSLSNFGALTNVAANASTGDSTRVGVAWEIFPTAQSGLSCVATFSGTSGNKALALASFAEAA